ncbi:MAG: hypothetical protein B6D63_00455 [Candidatus Latescibacteria bacterium 4484_7]|nr:MAG: hypothetical protein B6D63_00455 [Candidatus Latescibacteria bacterium 4484_7]RKZ05716.1 MAG: hypothetical protein DRQ05_05950 [bacterium]
MADEEEKKEEQAEVPVAPDEKKKGKGLLGNKMVLIAIVVVLQLVIAIVVAKMMVSKAMPKEDKPSKEEVAEEESEGRGSIVMLDDIIVNLKEGDRLYYLKLKVGLEVPNAAVQKEVEARSAQLRDIIISIVSGKKISELDTLEDRNALKIVLLNKLSDVLKSGDLIQVYFADFVVQ